MENQLLEHIIKGTRGKIFSATFIKKDGTLRKMTARLGVKKGVTGEGLKFNPRERSLVVVYEMSKKSFRMINLNTIQSITFKNQTLNFN
jgi:hypothetical protein